MNTDPTLEAPVAQLPENADSDVQFARRIALTRYTLIETKVDAVAAIRTTFRIQLLIILNFPGFLNVCIFIGGRNASLGTNH